MCKYVKKFIRICTTCQLKKLERIKLTGLLQPLPIPNRIQSATSTYFIEGLLVSINYSAILVVIDRLSKYCNFIPLKHHFNSISITRVFVREIVRLYAILESIVSDKDKNFTNFFWDELFILQKIKFPMSSSYHPQIDGQTEVTNRISEQYSWSFTCEQPKKWYDWLARTEYSYNTSRHSSTQISPFEVIYGRAHPTLTAYISGATNIAVVDQFLSNREEVLHDLKRRL